MRYYYALFFTTILHKYFSYCEYEDSCSICILLFCLDVLLNCANKLIQAKTVTAPSVWSSVILCCMMLLEQSNTGMSSLFMFTLSGTVTASLLGGSSVTIIPFYTDYTKRTIWWPVLFFFYFFISTAAVELANDCVCFQ